MLDQLPDWVGPAVAALIAGVFGTQEGRDVPPLPRPRRPRRGGGE